MTRLAPHRRGLAVVFQDAALFPHLSVRDDLAARLGARPRPDEYGDPVRGRVRP